MTDVLSEAIELLEMEKGRTEVEREEALAASRDQAEDYETLDTLAGRIEGLEVAIDQLRALDGRN